MEITNLPEFENKEQLVLSGRSAANLRSAMVWGKFLGIMLFVAAGAMAVVAIVCFSMPYDIFSMMAAGSAVAGVVYLIGAILYFFMGYFLYVGASKIKKAIDEGSNTALEAGTGNLKNYFCFYGVLTIVALAIVVVGLIIAITTGIAMAL